MPGAVTWLRFSPKLHYVDELEFVQGVPHDADEKDLSAPLATEPQAPSR